MKELGRIITLPKIFDPRGNLTVAEGETNIPFAIARAYWTYDVPGGEELGAMPTRNVRNSSLQPTVPSFRYAR